MTGNRNVNISSEILQKYERLLMAGVWSNLLVGYDDTIRYRGKTYPFVIERLEPVQVGRVDLGEYCAGRAAFSRDQWIDALVRTMGYEPTAPEMTERVKLLYLVRLIPLVEPNYHLIELGPRQTGKSFCFTEFSPYGTLLAGAAVTVPKLFVSNTMPPRPGLINQRDVVGFDEIAGSAFNADDDKNLYKNYMESGQINRGTITVKGDAGFVFNGNINFDPREGLLAEHLFKPLPATVADDTAFHDRLGRLPSRLGTAQAHAGNVDDARRLHPRLRQRGLPPRAPQHQHLRHALAALVRGHPRRVERPATCAASTAPSPAWRS